jgi:hypothetical protein
MASHFSRRPQEAYRRLDPPQQTALVGWLAFTTTFTLVRVITHSIRGGKGPFRNVKLGGEHIHHYLWGIAMVAAAGGIALRGEEVKHWHPALGATYGAGSALVVDEFALLLDLEDVYWAKQGRVSVDTAVGLIAAAGSYFAAVDFWHHLVRGHPRGSTG